MATRSVTPRANNEGGIGTTLLRWATGFIDALVVTTLNALTFTAQSVGFTISGGTTSKTLTVLQNVTLESSTDLYPIHEITEFPDDHTKAGLDLLDDADAAVQRVTLGLGTMATQASNAVAISGGAISGITDLGVADGGTGSSMPAAARTALGLAIGADVMAYEAFPIHEIDELCSVD